MTGHRLLFCSSYLASETALALQLAVESKGHTVTHWQDLFRRETSNQFTEVIIKDLQQEDFVVVFLTPDASVSNQTKEGEQSSFVPNANLIFELGLAWGAIGADRVIMVRLNSQERRPQLPSDLEGITRIEQFSVEELRHVDRLKALVEAITNAMAHKARGLLMTESDAETGRLGLSIMLTVAMLAPPICTSLLSIREIYGFRLFVVLYTRAYRALERSAAELETLRTRITQNPRHNAVDGFRSIVLRTETMLTEEYYDWTAIVAREELEASA